jgi:hypothetical protein
MSLSELFSDTMPFILAPRLIISIWDTHAQDDCLYVSAAFADCVCLTSPPKFEQHEMISDIRLTWPTGVSFESVHREQNWKVRVREMNLEHCMMQHRVLMSSCLSRSGSKNSHWRYGRLLDEMLRERPHLLLREFQLRSFGLKILCCCMSWLCDRSVHNGRDLFAFLVTVFFGLYVRVSHRFPDVSFWVSPLYLHYLIPISFYLFVLLFANVSIALKVFLGFNFTGFCRTRVPSL